MKEITKITINGNEYPCRITMGAMLRFKRETGRDVSQMADDDVADMVTFLWCCIASACHADGVPFDIALMDFADMLGPDSIREFYDGMDAAHPDEKKTDGRPTS